MTLHRTLAVSLTLLLASTNLSLSQEEDFIKAELVTLSEKSNIKDLWFMSKDGPRKLSVYERDFTMAEKYTGPRIIHFYENEASLNLPAEERPEPKATAELPEEGGEVMLIFAEEHSEDPEDIQWSVRVFDNSVENFPSGAYRFINHTPSACRVILDEKETQVEPNSHVVIRSDGGEAIREMHAKLGIGEDIVFSTVWEHRSDRRATVFVTSDPNGRNGISVRRFTEGISEPIEKQ